MLKQIRAAAAQAVALAPASQVYGTETRPHLAIDECLNSKRIQKTVARLLGSGLACAGSVLGNEIYLNPDGKSLAPFDFDPARPENPVIALRRASLPRMKWPDRRVATQSVGQLYLNRNVVVLSSDLGSEEEGLRGLLSRGIAPELNNEQRLLSLTLLLQNRHTTIDDYIRELIKLVKSQPLTPGYRELLI